MSFVEAHVVAITTTATGAATVYTTDSVIGHLDAIKVTATGTTSTADLVITGETSLQPIMTKANITKQTSTHFYPRAPVHTVAAGASTSGVVLTKIPLAFERIKTVMAGGGNKQSYTITFYVG